MRAQSINRVFNIFIYACVIAPPPQQYLVVQCTAHIIINSLCVKNVFICVCVCVCAEKFMPYRRRISTLNEARTRVELAFLFLIDYTTGGHHMTSSIHIYGIHYTYNANAATFSLPRKCVWICGRFFFPYFFH